MNMKKALSRFIVLVNCIKVIIMRLRWKGVINIALRQHIGKGIEIWSYNKGRINIEAYLFTRRNVLLISDGGEINIGEHVFLNQNVSITSRKNITIGDHTTIGNNVVIVDHDHNRNGSGFIENPVNIKDNVWIGANCAILKGVTIGENSVVAAGSVVVSDVPANSVVAGLPARIIKRM